MAEVKSYIRIRGQGVKRPKELKLGKLSDKWFVKRRKKKTSVRPS